MASWACSRTAPARPLLLRTDLDALPVAEETGLPYASKVRTKDERGATVGVMHACGHDMHMTNLVGVARYLAAHRDEWSGTLVFIGQPAEERGAGATAMLEDGLFRRFPRPDFAVALHVASELPPGKIEYRGGYAHANVDSVDITIKGRGGHGAAPDTTIDPDRDRRQAGARPADDRQPRDEADRAGGDHGRLDPRRHQAQHHRRRVQTAAHGPQLHAGGAREAARRDSRKALAAAASAAAPEPVIDVSEGTPAVFNDEELTDRVAKSIKNASATRTSTKRSPRWAARTLASTAWPACRFACSGWAPSISRGSMSSQQKGQSPPSLHSAQYYPNAEASLRASVPAMVAVAVDLLPPHEPAPRQESERDGCSVRFGPLVVALGRRLRRDAGRDRVVAVRGPRLGAGRT